MTVTSQNGWLANDRSVIGSFTVPGTTRRLALRVGDVSVVLLDLAAWIHANVRPIDTGILDDWGYAERLVRGSASDLSNHASGTAMDLDATLHPLGVRGTWTAAEKAKIHARLALYAGVVRWGEDYDGRLDGMHFEINAGASAVRAVADRIRAGQLAPAIHHQEDDAMYIKCATAHDGEFTGILSGSLLIGFGGWEASLANEQIAKGATVQWVTEGTLAALDEQSHNVHDVSLKVALAAISSKLDRLAVPAAGPTV